MITDPDRFAATIGRFDAANEQDPHRQQGQPAELVYAQRMTEMLERFAPDAPEPVRLAVRAQHIERWKTPRSSYPEGRAGYLAWRADLYEIHARRAAHILAEAGYEEAVIQRVADAIAKRNLKSNPDAQAVEDIAALVFLEHYLADFAARHPDYDEAKWTGILRKTWRKMSPAAREFALGGDLELPPTLAPLIARALGG
jgi:hypothetical protein